MTQFYNYSRHKNDDDDVKKCVEVNNNSHTIEGIDDDILMPTLGVQHSRPPDNEDNQQQLLRKPASTITAKFSIDVDNISQENISANDFCKSVNDFYQAWISAAPVKQESSTTAQMKQERITATTMKQERVLTATMKNPEVQ